MSKIITISIDDEYLEKLDIIVKIHFTDRSKLIRKWIDDEYSDLDKKEE